MENINKLIVSTLKPIGVPIYFVYKPENIQIDDYITFNYLENENWFSNNSSEINEFSVTLNYISNDLGRSVQINDNIKTILKNNERLVSVKKFQTTFDNSKRCYLTIFTFKIYK